MLTITNRFLRASLMRVVSFTPKPRPIPMIGPIRGEISIAPMMTAVEFTFRPTDAMIIENARIQTLGPRKAMLPRMFLAAASVSMWSEMLAMVLSSALSLVKNDMSVSYFNCLFL